MNDNTKGMLLVAGIATLAGLVYLMSKGIDAQTKNTTTVFKGLTSDTATQLVKSSEAVINAPIKAGTKVLKTVNWIFK